MDWWWNLLAAMDAHEGQAAWAQAVFSVVAIIAAAAFPSIQGMRVHRRYREALATLLRSAFAEINGVWVLIDQPPAVVTDINEAMSASQRNLRTIANDL